jgi:3-hydroxyacyl-CoA dehydrogenase
VVGAGTMGAGFAELCILGSLDVAAPTPDSLTRGQGRLSAGPRPGRSG